MRVGSFLAWICVGHAARVDMHDVDASENLADWVLPGKMTFPGNIVSGKNDDNYNGAGKSPFELYMRNSSEVGCPPRVFRSTCGSQRFLGQVVFIHGFSGCSDQADKLGMHLSQQCFDVLAPTLPGHGTPFHSCKTAYCSVRITPGKGFDLRNLPSSEDGYIDFAGELLSVVKREKLHRALSVGKHVEDNLVHIIGFALGAPVALHMVMEEPKLFSSLMLLNPYFAMADETIDRKAVQCEADAKDRPEEFAKCRHQAILSSLSSFGVGSEHSDNKYLNWLASSRGTFEKRLMCNLAKLSNAFGEEAGKDADGSSMLHDLMEGENEWNTICQQTLKQGRKGFCKFKTKHLLALHAFGIRTLVDAQAWGKWRNGVPRTKFVVTARDGKTRNGVTYRVAMRLFNKQADGDVSMCLHRFTSGIDKSDPGNYWNDWNVQPHAIMMPKDVHAWWEEGLYSRITSFVKGERSSEPTIWDGKKESCSALPLQKDALDRNPELRELLVPEAASSSKVNCVWVGPIWQTVKVYDKIK